MFQRVQIFINFVKYTLATNSRQIFGYLQNKSELSDIEK